MFALFVVIILLLGYYLKGSLGNKYRELADQVSPGQFDPKRATFNMTSTTNVDRSEVVETTGITTSTINTETSNRNITQSNAKPGAGDKLFDSKW